MLHIPPPPLQAPVFLIMFSKLLHRLVYSVFYSGIFWFISLHIDNFHNVCWGLRLVLNSRKTLCQGAFERNAAEAASVTVSGFQCTFTGLELEPLHNVSLATLAAWLG